MSEFDSMFKDMKNEVLALKTMHIKTPETMKTTSKSFSVSIPLKLIVAAGSVAVGAKMSVFTCTSSDGDDFLATCTLKGTTTLNGRIIYAHRTYAQTGQVIFNVFVSNGNEQDYQTLWNGGSVTVNFNVEITTTSSVSITQKYENINWE